MKLTITSIELASPFRLFRLWIYSFQIINQLKTTNCISFKTRGRWTKHYTMSLWRNDRDIREFVRKGGHLHAMKNAKKVAKEITTLNIEADIMPSWIEAKSLLKKQGKKISL